jgi:UDP-N-acetylglucosamine--N-acetylmuramyl-(pentapeptide) pyrophosphoryl-undecaprenol N-acetylglucosamine transferase
VDKRVLILAGGTGGHVYPALAVAKELIDRGSPVSWIGTRTGLEARVIPAEGIEIDWLSVSGVRGKGWLAKLMSPLMLVRACLQAARILLKRRPAVVLGMGGFVSGPGALVSRMFRIPLIVHEQNRVPGTTNRWLAKVARVVLEAFPGSFDRSIGATCTGNPLRRELTALPPRTLKDAGDGSTKVLVLGGSQGASVLNTIVPEAIAGFTGPISVLHQAGQAMQRETRDRYDHWGVAARVEAFIDNMAAAYEWADIAVCRAGAMTISELMAAGLPAVLVPFPYAIDDHQTQNARYLADAGAAVCIPQTDLSPAHLTQVLQQLTQDTARLAEMARRARALARLDATQTVADVCLREASR